MPNAHGDPDDSASKVRKRVELSEALVRNIVRWEQAPHNEPGQDNAWVERLIEDWHEHYRVAGRVR